MVYEIRYCIKCGKEIPKIPSNSVKTYAKRLWCSNLCKRNPERHCAVCGKVFRRRGKHQETGKCCSDKCKDIYKKGKIPPNLKIAQAASPIKKGAINPRWKGGISAGKRSLNTPEYKLWRLSIFERDNFTCQMPGCGQRGGNLESHHIKSWTDFKELRFDTKNGITLCLHCHNRTKGKEKLFIPLFVEINRLGYE